MSVDTNAVIAWLSEYSLRVAALIVIVGAGSLIARRASAHGRLFAWTVVLHLAVAMPLLTLLLPEVPLPSGFSAPAIVIPNAQAWSDGPADFSIDSTTRGFWPSQAALAFIYLSGVGILLLRLAAGWYVTSRVVRRARTVHGLVVPAAVRVVESESVHVPFACGVVRPALVLPVTWRSWDEVTLQAVLAHELSHIARRDLWALRLAAIYRAAIWVNPLSWWLRRKLETLAERASDDAVLASGVEPTAYAEVLVRFFEEAQLAPGRASWQLAMARRGGTEANKRVGRVLSTREGGRMAMGLSGRVLVALGVSMVAVPVIVLAAGAPDAVTIQEVPVVIAIAPTPQQQKQMMVDVKVKPKADKMKQETVDLKIEGKDGKLEAKTVDIQIQQANQDLEFEPWRSTKRAQEAGVVAPKMTRSLQPKYTPDAMRAKIQGMVELELIVSATGDVTEARVLQSIDAQMGLDEEALKAARQWTFLPGTFEGQPIPVRVRLTMSFKLH